MGRLDWQEREVAVAFVLPPGLKWMDLVQSSTDRFYRVWNRSVGECNDRGSTHKDNQHC